MIKSSSRLSGASAGNTKVWMVVSICLIVTVLLTGVATGWAMVQYFEEKRTVDIQAETAASLAAKEQADKDAADFLEKEKEPNREFAGPDDYGRLSFKYPKTWSLYLAQNSTSGGKTYEAYFNPVSVPPIAKDQRVALRVTIEQEDYEEIIDDYAGLVEDGELTTSAVTINGAPSTRLDGNFTKDIRGSAVVIKVLDKTVTIRTDADTFKGDFDALIKTITFKS